MAAILKQPYEKNVCLTYHLMLVYVFQQLCYSHILNPAIPSALLVCSFACSFDGTDYIQHGIQQSDIIGQDRLDKTILQRSKLRLVLGDNKKCLHGYHHHYYHAYHDNHKQKPIGSARTACIMHTLNWRQDWYYSSAYAALCY